MTPNKDRFPKDDEMNDDFLYDRGNEDVVLEPDSLFDTKIETKGGTFYSGKSCGMFMPNDIMRNPDGTAMIPKPNIEHEDAIWEQLEKEERKIEQYFDVDNQSEKREV